MAEKNNEKKPTSFLFTEKQLLDGGKDSVLHRRILFHPARNKTDNGCQPDDFYLEPLNPQPDLCSPETPIAKPTLPKPSVRKNHGQEEQGPLETELKEEFQVRRVGAGLANLGNTCFLNSVLQCLTYTQPLAAYLQSGLHKSTCRVAGFCAMCAVQDHAINALGSSGKIVSPVTLVRHLRCISRNFRMSRQEDAHEYMVNLIEAMHKCCLPAGVKSESPVAYEKSLMHKIFGGRLISQVKCMQCSYCSNKFDPFLDLSLEIIRADSLLRALSHYTSLDQLDGGEKRYQCERCKVKVKALKQLKIDKAPYILAIHLKRFSTGGTGGKIDKKVDFGCTLDLKPFVSSSQEGDMIYTLYGVLVHDGWSTHSGHYYCFIRTSTGIWHALDDSRVYQVSEKSVLSQKAYMLFYARDKGNSMKRPYGLQFEVNVSKVNETASFKITCAKENNLKDSCAPQMTANLRPHFVNASGANTTCNLVKQPGNVSDGNLVETFGNRDSTRQQSCESGQTVNHGASSESASIRNKDMPTNNAFSNCAASNDLEANRSCYTIMQQGCESIRTGAMFSCNGNQVVKHSKTSVVSNNNGHCTGKNPGVNSTNNGIRHPEANLNDLRGKGGGQMGVKHSKNLSNGNYGALQNPENGDTVSSTKDNELQTVKHLSPRDGSDFQEGGNATLAFKAIAANSSSLKTNQPGKISAVVKDSGSVSTKHHKNLKESNHPISGKTLKLIKHLEHPHFLKTFPFNRYFLLKSMSISRKERSNERKKRMKLNLNNHGVLLKRKPAGTERSGHSVASKKAIEQSCGKDLNKKYNLGLKSKTTELTIGVSENGCGHAKFEQGNAASSSLKRKKFLSGNRKGVKNERKIVEQCFTNVDQCSESMDEMLSAAQPKNAVKVSNCAGLSKVKTVSIDQLNGNSIDGGKSCKERAVSFKDSETSSCKERAVSFKNRETSSVEAKLRVAAVPCWDGVDDDWVKKNRTWDGQTVRVGHVLDEWDEEYDRGKRKKVKQIQDGTDDLSGGYSDGQMNPFQQLANSKVKIHNTTGKSFKRSNKMEI